MNSSSHATTTTNRSRARMKTLVILLLLAAHIGQVGSYIALANYNFYGLSSGTTNIQCTVDPVNNLDWQLASKSLQLILPNCNRNSFLFISEEY